LAAFEQLGSSIRWVTPIQESARKLLDTHPVAGVNMPNKERSDHVEWALQLLEKSSDAFDALTNERRVAIEESNNRLRGMLKQRKIEVKPHAPDILGCYVLVPGGKR
jgi:hypothetical protein